MNQLENQINLLLASQVFEIAAKLRSEDSVRAGIHLLDDSAESRQFEDAWYSQHPISDYVPKALQRLQDVDRQIQALLTERT